MVSVPPKTPISTSTRIQKSPVEGLKSNRRGSLSPKRRRTGPVESITAASANEKIVDSWGVDREVFCGDLASKDVLPSVFSRGSADEGGATASPLSSFAPAAYHSALRRC